MRVQLVANDTEILYSELTQLPWSESSHAFFMNLKCRFQVLISFSAVFCCICRFSFLNRYNANILLNTTSEIYTIWSVRSASGDINWEICYSWCIQSLAILHNWAGMHYWSALYTYGGFFGGNTFYTWSRICGSSRKENSKWRALGRESSKVH